MNARMLAALAAFLAGCATPPPQPATIPAARVPEIPVDLLKPGGAGPGRGATTGGNPEAWADSRQQVAGFLARHLRH